MMKKVWIVLLLVVATVVLISQYYKLTSSPKSVNQSANKIDSKLDDMIRVITPQRGDLIASPLQITGQARGNWYFEGSFPVKLLGADGSVIASGIAQAQDEWMTDNFVPFIANITFTNPNSSGGAIILQRDNPSGLPQYDAAFSLPIHFLASNQEINKDKQCLITGCSQQLCANQEVITTCEFRPEYVCYTKAKCEPQADGSCGWTETDDLKTCLAEFN